MGRKILLLLRIRKIMNDVDDLDGDFSRYCIFFCVVIEVNLLFCLLGVVIVLVFRESMRLLFDLFDLFSVLLFVFLRRRLVFLSLNVRLIVFVVSSGFGLMMLILRWYLEWGMLMRESSSVVNGDVVDRIIIEEGRRGE